MCCPLLQRYFLGLLCLLGWCCLLGSISWLVVDREKINIHLILKRDSVIQLKHHSDAELNHFVLNTMNLKIHLKIIYTNITSRNIVNRVPI